MKKIRIILCACIIMVIILLSGCTNQNKNMDNKDDVNNNVQEEINKNSIAYTGWLKTEGANLLNEKGEPIQLRGLSSHGIQWFPDVLTFENLKELKDNWNINVFRIAMYTDENANGYIVHPEESKADVNKIVEYAKELDMYVIVDWHILHDNNPQMYESQAIEFFNEMSTKYANVPNVIYEICNEPNGYNVTWNNNVKPYAENVIKTIRANSPKSLIIIGTPDWCKDLISVANNPLDVKNVVYACHFYAGTHGNELQSKIDECINKKIPIFVSECGITDASGNGPIYEEKYRAWINFLDERNISYIYWSFCNKDESSSILKPDYVPTKKVQTTETEGTIDNNIETNNSNENNKQIEQSTQDKQNTQNAQNNTNTQSMQGTQNPENVQNQNKLDSNTNNKNEEKIVPVDINDYLSDSGKIIKDIFTGKN